MKIIMATVGSLGDLLPFMVVGGKQRRLLGQGALALASGAVAQSSTESVTVTG